MKWQQRVHNRRMKYGYARISTIDQNADMQLKALQCASERLYNGRAASKMASCRFAFVLLTIGFAVAANAQTEKTFPTNDEITLVLTQTQRAIQQYKPLIEPRRGSVGQQCYRCRRSRPRRCEQLRNGGESFQRQTSRVQWATGFPFL